MSAFPRWNACQRHIGVVLWPLGSDAQAKDAARVLRVVGTRNEQRLVYSLLPVGEIHEFSQLADQVLPLTQAQLHDNPNTEGRQKAPGSSLDASGGSPRERCGRRVLATSSASES